MTPVLSRLKKHRLSFVSVISVVLLCTSCLSVPETSPLDLYQHISGSSNIIGYWNISQDAVGQLYLKQALSLRESLLKRVRYAVFGVDESSKTEGTLYFTLALSGTWSQGLISFSLNWSDGWKKISEKGEPLLYHNSEQSLWMHPEDGFLVLSNYHYTPFLQPLSGITRNLSIIDWHEGTKQSFLKLHFSNRYHTGLLEKLDIQEMDVAISGSETYTGNIGISFSSVSSRRLMTPLVKLSLLPMLLTPGTSLPSVEYQENTIVFRDFNILYKKLIDTFLPMVLGTEPMVEQS